MSFSIYLLRYYSFLQVAASFPLVGDKERIESLSCEYDADDVIYQAKLQVYRFACLINHDLFIVSDI